MRTSVALYHRHRLSTETINQMRLVVFPFVLSSRDVEEMLATRGVALSYETTLQQAYLVIPAPVKHHSYHLKPQETDAD